MPFMLFFDVPLHVNAELDLTANAALTLESTRPWPSARSP